jgi:hypothetical protein
VPLTRTSFREVKEVVRHLKTGDPNCANMGRIYTRELPDNRLWLLVERKRDDKSQNNNLKKFAKKRIRATAPA